MNFLSHYYFTQHKKDPYFSMGTILPDLLRNYKGSWKIKPEKEVWKFKKNPHFDSLSKGWSMHLAVDNQFHTSTIFLKESSALRRRLAPVFKRLPIRPFFLAHIGYELILDSLLIQNELVNTDDFYREIEDCELNIILDFLRTAGIKDPSGFAAFLHSFIESRYLESYSESKSIVYALDRIGRRVWQEKFNEHEIKESILIVQELKEWLNPTFIKIFKEIEESLTF